MTSIGERIREARLQRGMTQSELSADLVTPSMISQIESNRTRPSYPLIVAIANRLSLPPEYFMNEMEDQYSSLAHVQLARAYLGFGKWQEALTVMQDTTAPEAPGLAFQEHQIVLSEVFRHAGRLDEAICILEELRELALRNQDYPLLFAVCHQAGYIEYDTGNADGAIHEWETAISMENSVDPAGHFSTVTLQSDMAEIHYHLYSIYRNRGEDNRALRCLEKAVSLTDQSGRLNSIVDSLIRDGLHMLEGHEPSRAQDLFHRASVVAASARFLERAVYIDAEYRRAAGDDPGNPWTQMTLAATTASPANLMHCEIETIRFFLLHGRLKDAERRIAQCLEILHEYTRTRSTSFHDLRAYEHTLSTLSAEILYRLGDTDGAFVQLESVLGVLDPNESSREWLQAASLMVQWHVSKEDFVAAAALTQRMKTVYEALERKGEVEREIAH